MKLHPVVNDAVAGEEVLVVLDLGTDTATAYDRTVDGQTLTFDLSAEGQGGLAVL